MILEEMVTRPHIIGESKAMDEQLMFEFSRDNWFLEIKD
jgi:hypothetical protein